MVSLEIGNGEGLQSVRYQQCHIPTFTFYLTASSLGLFTGVPSQLESIQAWLLSVFMVYHFDIFIYGLPLQVPIYNFGCRETVAIKHFAQEFKHGDSARIRTCEYMSLCVCVSLRLCNTFTRLVLLSCELLYCMFLHQVGGHVMHYITGNIFLRVKSY